MKKQFFLFIFAVILFLFGLLTLYYKIEPFYYFFYITSWWSYIIVLDSALSFTYKRFYVLNKNLPFIIIISSGYWCFFELLNVRLQNWFYISLPSEFTYRYLGYLLAFGTVIPAIALTRKAVLTVLGKINVKPYHAPRYSLYALTAGCIALFLTIAVPRYCFALTWVFPFLICDGINHLRRNKSFMDCFQKSRGEDFAATILSGLICGFLWEFWNYWSVSKWVYSVPFFERGKIFEMPLAGYIGFPLFSLGTIAFLYLFTGIKTRRWKSLLAAVAVICSLTAFPVIDRYTAFSYIPKTENLAFLKPETVDILKKNRIYTSYEIDPQLLSREERQPLELLHLKGLGYKNLSLLKQSGIYNIEDLSKTDEETLSTILKEKNMERIRIYLRAAKSLQKNFSRIDIPNISMVKYQP